jgi:predicted acylesterase/phospholipase RssA
VLKVLQDLGVVTPGAAPPRVAGISSGAITAGVVCSGLTEQRFHATVRLRFFIGEGTACCCCCCCWWHQGLACLLLVGRLQGEEQC